MESNLAVSNKCMYLQQSYFCEAILQKKESIFKAVHSAIFAEGLLTMIPKIENNLNAHH